MKNTSQTKRGTRKDAGIEFLFRDLDRKIFYRETIPTEQYRRLMDLSSRLGFKTWQGALKHLARKKQTTLFKMLFVA